jgi:hypothetical protein
LILDLRILQHLPLLLLLLEEKREVLILEIEIQLNQGLHLEILAILVLDNQ